jgi:hypothetical protein
MTAFLIIDFEATGLRVSDITLLEGAWAITDPSGSMRSPMQHRYLSIYNNKLGHSPQIVPFKRDNEKAYWKNKEQRTGETEKFARSMAEKSLLFQDHIECNPDFVLRDGFELERLLLDNIADVCDTDETVHICGAGVARFDFSILRLHCPRVVVPSGVRGQVSYRPVDTSGNLTGLVGSKLEQGIIKWYIDSEAGNTFIDLDESPRYCFGNRDVASWLAGERQHRSAPDVARAIVTQRALWSVGAPLREALGVVSV